MNEIQVGRQRRDDSDVYRGGLPIGQEVDKCLAAGKIGWGSIGQGSTFLDPPDLPALTAVAERDDSLITRQVVMAAMFTDLPDPVVPAIKRCGMAARSATTA